MIPESDKRGNIARALARHVHAFSSCGCVPLPIGSRITGMCVRCKVEYDTTERIKVEALRLNRQLQEDALRLDLMVRGEALQNQADELRLQQNRLNKETQDHKKAVKKAQEQHAKRAKDLAVSCQGKRTKVMSLRYTNIK